MRPADAVEKVSTMRFWPASVGPSIIHGEGHGCPRRAVEELLSAHPSWPRRPPRGPPPRAAPAPRSATRLTTRCQADTPSSSSTIRSAHPQDRRPVGDEAQAEPDWKGLCPFPADALISKTWKQHLPLLQAAARAATPCASSMRQEHLHLPEAVRRHLRAARSPATRASGRQSEARGRRDGAGRRFYSRSLRNAAAEASARPRQRGP